MVKEIKITEFGKRKVSFIHYDQPGVQLGAFIMKELVEVNDFIKLENFYRRFRRNNPDWNVDDGDLFHDIKYLIHMGCVKDERCCERCKRGYSEIPPSFCPYCKLSPHPVVIKDYFKE